MQTCRALVVALLFINCAGRQSVRTGDVPPDVRVSLLHQARASQQWLPLKADESAPPDEPISVEVTVREAAYVATVLHAPQGESVDLGEATAQQWPAGTARRFPIPRRAPPGVVENELRLFVVASTAPLSGAALGLLRLPCRASRDTGRGDRDDNGDQSGSGDKGTRDTGQPGEGERKGPDREKLCAAPAGRFDALTVVPVVLRFR